MEWLNYHHLYYFWAVAREESISRAGERLSLAPSTVSAQLSKLEEMLGGKLFRRVGRNLELTEMGRIVYRYADEIFSLGREMVDTVRGRPVSGPIRLVVGIVDAVPKLVARKLLEPALRLAEHIHLICHEGKEEQLLAELSVHGLDIVLTDMPVKTGLSVKAYSHLLGECSVSFFATEQLAAKLTGDFPRSLDGAPMLLPTPMSALRGSLDKWFDSLNIRPVIAGEFDDQALLKVFGQAGDGVFAAPSVIEEEVRQQHNVKLIGRSEAIREQFYAISVERIIKHPAVAAIQKAASNLIFLQHPGGHAKMTHSGK
ncbi:MAG: LysR family transcriptional regulator [Desulfobulbaceae bacterium DB1]|nr:MAG: LysR family transcriptional regulator [Desulfobulbaceae bacterium DB1]